MLMPRSSAIYRLRVSRGDRQGPSLALRIVAAVLVGALLGLVRGLTSQSGRPDHRGDDDEHRGIGCLAPQPAHHQPSARAAPGSSIRSSAGRDRQPPGPRTGPRDVLRSGDSDERPSSCGLQFALFRTRWGLRTRAVGSTPRLRHGRHRRIPAALSERDPRWPCRLAGAFLTLESTGHPERMTNGRGFIALAAMIFGRWTRSRVRRGLLSEPRRPRGRREIRVRGDPARA